MAGTLEGQAKHAMAAVSSLHHRPASDLQLPLRPHSRTSLAGQGQLWARQVVGEGQHWKRWRIILRNLPFKVRGTTC